LFRSPPPADALADPTRRYGEEDHGADQKEQRLSRLARSDAEDTLAVEAEKGLRTGERDEPRKDGEKEQKAALISTEDDGPQGAGHGRDALLPVVCRDRKSV